MKQVIKINHHTILTLVAPTYSGKSTISESITSKCLSLGISCVVISSDEIRRELLCKTRDDNIRTAESLIANDETFKVLFRLLESHVTYPINTQVVIVDTTGLDPDFRKQVREIAFKHQYTSQLLILNPTPSIVIPRIKEPNMVTVFNRHYKRLKEGVLPFIKDYKPVPIVLNTGDELEIEFPNLELHNLTTITSPCVFIGDVHESLDLLKRLIERIRKKYGNIDIYLLGDWIDKQGKALEIIDYLIANPDIKLIVGNHEAYVYKTVNLIHKDRDLEMEKEHFTSVSQIIDKPEYVEKFNILFNRSLPFAKVQNENIVAYFTHAPCLNKYIGKFDKTSLIKQMKERYDWNIPISSQLSHLIDEAKNNSAIHIFGHVMFDKNDHKYKNKYAIDLGAYAGGSLGAFIIKPDFSVDTMYQKGFNPLKDKLVLFSDIKPTVEITHND